MSCKQLFSQANVLHIGYDGENKWRSQTFDCAGLLKKHPDAQPSWAMSYNRTFNVREMQWER